MSQNIVESRNLKLKAHITWFYLNTEDLRETAVPNVPRTWIARTYTFPFSYTFPYLNIYGESPGTWDRTSCLIDLHYGFWSVSVLCYVADILEGRVVNPEGPWQGWQVGLHNIMKFSKSKCKVLHRHEDTVWIRSGLRSALRRRLRGAGAWKTECDPVKYAHRSESQTRLGLHPKHPSVGCRGGRGSFPAAMHLALESPGGFGFF